MLHRFSPLLLMLLLSLTVATRADAAPPTQTNTPTQTTPADPTVAVDRVLVKLNALEDQLDAMTVKLDAATAKLDALTLKTKDVWETTHYTKGYLQGAVPTIFDLLELNCGMTGETRDLAAYAAYSTHLYAHIYNCP